MSVRPANRKNNYKVRKEYYTTDPSTFLDNSASGGAGGAGFAGGTGTKLNGGNGGTAGLAQGGGLFIGSGSITTNIGNTTFYGNTVTGGTGGAGGAAATGGTAGTSQNGGDASGGGLELQNGPLTMVNSTVAKNTVTGGTAGGSGATQGLALGGGILDAAAVTLDNNTITQNTIGGGTGSVGSGVAVTSGNPTLVNNLIQGDSGGASTFDLDTSLDTGNTILSNANHNFITSISTNAVSTTSNIVGNTQTQLGAVRGVSSGGTSSGGPIYYPLLPHTVSLGAGSSSVLSTIATVEGNPATVTDEIGNPRSTDGSIDLGAVQSPASSPSPSPSPSTVTGPPESLISAIIGLYIAEVEKDIHFGNPTAVQNAIDYHAQFAVFGSFNLANIIESIADTNVRNAEAGGTT